MIAAGFECGHLGWCNQDLLVDGRHTPDTDMTKHYRDAMALGVTTFRDGLPWRNEPTARLDAVPYGATTIWDLSHFDQPPNPREHAKKCAAAFGWRGPRPHILAINEPSMWPDLARPNTREDAINTGLALLNGFAEVRPDAKFYTADPFHDIDEESFRATDALVNTGLIDCVGINLYPHHASVGVRNVVLAVRERYGLPVALTETGLHEGHPRTFQGILTRPDWLAHVRAEAEDLVEFICWYPWLDMPAWGRPEGSNETWPDGWPGGAV